MSHNRGARRSPKIEEFVRSNRQEIAADAKIFADALTIALHTPAEECLISPRMRVYLKLIGGVVRKLGKMPEALILALPEVAGHRTFVFRDMDLATVQIAIEEENPEEFFAPLLGGEKFLSHILRCPYCIASLTATADDVAVNPDFAFLMEVVSESYSTEAAQQGLHLLEDPVDPQNIREAFKKPVSH